jgi:uncharacterized protein with PQ loop repeat
MIIRVVDTKDCCKILPPFQIISHFSFSRFMAFSIHLIYAMSRNIGKTKYM